MLLKNFKVHYSVHNSRSLVSMPREMNPKKNSSFNNIYFSSIQGSNWTGTHTNGVTHSVFIKKKSLQLK